MRDIAGVFHVVSFQVSQCFTKTSTERAHRSWKELVVSLNASERRFALRLPIRDDLAEIVVEIRGTPHEAILADESATGFGLLLLRGSKVAIGELVVLRCDLVRHECAVTHIEPGEDFQTVGLKRVREVSLAGLPKLGRVAWGRGSPFGATGSPWLFLGLLGGLSLIAAALSALHGNGASNSDSSPQSDSRSRVAPASIEQPAAPPGSSTIERPEPMGSKVIAVATTETSTTARATATPQERLVSLWTGQRLDWDELSRQLALTRGQQTHLEGIADRAVQAQEPAAVTTSKATAVLNVAQRKLLEQLRRR